mgnify:CR=1 FL=1
MQVMRVELEDNDRKVLTYDSDCPRHYLGDGFITATRAMRSAIKQWREEFNHSAIIVWWSGACPSAAPLPLGSWGLSFRSFGTDLPWRQTDICGNIGDALLKLRHFFVG